MLKFLKNYTLPLAMLTGVVGHSIFVYLSFLTPFLIFFMLLLTFCKVSFSELKPTRLHVWLLLIQLAGAPVVYLLLREFDEVVAQAAMICVICPTATSAAVVTAKLGGSAASLTAYTLLINIGVSVMVPVMFPLIKSQDDISFLGAAFLILSRVFMLLICPLLGAWFLRKFTPKVHGVLLSFNELAFYLWAFALVIVTSQILSSMLADSAEIQVGIPIAIVTLLICCFQFFIGKTLGSVYNERISGGQALGQKNTILAIWMAHVYLNPIAAVGPGFYVLWQNIINSYQLWLRNKKTSKNGK
jgi:BASS family bile acid:Na+ symporter